MSCAACWPTLGRSQCRRECPTDIDHALVFAYGDKYIPNPVHCAHFRRHAARAKYCAMTSLTRILYTSAAAPNLDGESLKRLIKSVRGTNAALCVTSML